MKINLENSQNRQGVATIRGQISVAENLRNFDSFLARHEMFDFGNVEHMAAARASSGYYAPCSKILEMPPIIFE